MATSVGQGIQYGTDYAWQVFFDALSQAITSTASLQPRLATLVLGVYGLGQDHFPEADTWLRFQNLLTATAARSKSNPAKVLAATAKMSDQEAAKWLQEAVRIFSDLSEDIEV